MVDLGLNSFYCGWWLFYAIICGLIGFIAGREKNYFISLFLFILAFTMILISAGIIR